MAVRTVPGVLSDRQYGDRAMKAMKWQRWMAAEFGIAGSLWAAPVAVPQGERQQWLNHLLPLPHEIGRASCRERV